jgi:uncharacterized zinc-type alcohol dehydrogenase-like protein
MNRIKEVDRHLLVSKEERSGQAPSGIPIQKVNEAYERLLRSDVKYRFSIDMASLKSQ